MVVIWDGLPAHGGRAVKAFLREGASGRVHLEPLPGYAPELNPEEGIWKRRERRDLCCRDLRHLRYELRRAKERLRHKREVIRREGSARSRESGFSALSPARRSWPSCGSACAP